MDLDPKYSSAVSRRPGPREHIRCDEGDVAEYVLLPGDPGRVPVIAEHLDDARHVASSREYTTYTGTLDGTPVTITSTGIGGPSTAIAIEELVQLGARTLIRIGTCGAIHPDAHVGELIIATGAVRDDGTTRQYAPIAHPAVASPDVVHALHDAASSRGFKHHVGVVHTTDSFYAQHEPDRMPIATKLTNRDATLRSLGVLCSEMETATVFIVGGSVLGRRVGSVLAIAGNRTGGEHLDSPEMITRRDQAVQKAIIAAVEAVRFLAAQG
ncbi:MAG: uridine phosphorylase [Sciscionella sp.]